MLTSVKRVTFIALMGRALEDHYNNDPQLCNNCAFLFKKQQLS